ncbi:MAG: hypothetical protein ACT4TC_10450 [Myxococcaceae bacterium]
MLATLLEREIETEADMRDTALGKSSVSYQMPLLELIGEDGHPLKALVFRTNPHGPKALTYRDYFQDGLNEGGSLKPGALAYLMAARGGFERSVGEELRGGGRCLAYWDNSYFNTQATLREAVDPLLAEGARRARQVPDLEVLEDIAARAWSDPAARRQLDGLIELVEGAATPLVFRDAQKPEDALGLRRVPV